MAAQHLEFLVEEPSMAAFLQEFLPDHLPDISVQIHPYRGKGDLLANLENRLRGYAGWLPTDWRIFVLVDRDDDDCHQLKQRLESIASRAGLLTRRQAAGSPYQVVNRIVIEELEAWYFGHPEAVCAAYPRVNPNVFRHRRYRNPDAIAGGTWEAMQRVLKGAGYFKGGLLKVEAARNIAIHIVPERNCSPSFKVFYKAILDAMAD